MQYVQVYHLRVQVRPELNVIVRTLLNLLLQLRIQTLEGNNYRHVQIRKAAASVECLGLLRGKTALSILSD